MDKIPKDFTSIKYTYYAALIVLKNNDFFNTGLPSSIYEGNKSLKNTKVYTVQILKSEIDHQKGQELFARKNNVECKDIKCSYTCICITFMCHIN